MLKKYKVGFMGLKTLKEDLNINNIRKYEDTDSNIIIYSASIKINDYFNLDVYVDGFNPILLNISWDKSKTKELFKTLDEDNISKRCLKRMNDNKELQFSLFGKEIILTKDEYIKENYKGRSSLSMYSNTKETNWNFKVDYNLYKLFNFLDFDEKSFIAKKGIYLLLEKNEDFFTEILFSRKEKETVREISLSAKNPETVLELLELNYVL